MAIMLYMGYLGSGKTLSAVRNAAFSPMNTYTNIKVKRQITTTLITKHQILKEEVTKEKKDGTKEYGYSVNFDYWELQKKKHRNGFNIVIDEAHSIIDARTSMSKINRAAKKWASSLRKIISCRDGVGDVTFVSQLPRGVDVWVKELCNQYRWHEYFSKRQCKYCKTIYLFSSSSEEPQERCPSCDMGSFNELGSKMIVYRFKTIEDVEAYINFGAKTYYVADVINNPSYFYKYYDTYQIENLFE